jgi:hypothetical protein
MPSPLLRRARAGLPGQLRRLIRAVAVAGSPARVAARRLWWRLFQQVIERDECYRVVWTRRGEIVEATPAHDMLDTVKRIKTLVEATNEVGQPA